MHIVKIYKWLHHEKDRYYRIVVNKYKSDKIILDYDWGGCKSNRGGRKNISVTTEEEVQLYINKMMKRRKSRGYELITPLLH